MSELGALYREVILDHSKRPRNFQIPDPSDREVVGHNPLCGDRLRLGLVMDGDIIRDIGFRGNGCAISLAAASTMTEAVKGRSRAEAAQLFDSFHAMVDGTTGQPADVERLGKLAAFAGVTEFPMRIKCATLCWHTLKAALSGEATQITTE